MGTERMDNDTGGGDEDVPPPSHLDNASVSEMGFIHQFKFMNSVGQVTFASK
jgi:hypothetical protein